MTDLPPSKVLPIRQKTAEPSPEPVAELFEDIEHSLVTFAGWAGHAGAELLRARHRTWLESGGSTCTDPGETDPAIAALLRLAREALRVLKVIEVEAAKSA